MSPLPCLAVGPIFHHAQEPVGANEEDPVTEARYKVETMVVSSHSFELEFFADFDEVVDEFLDELIQHGGEEKYWPVFGNLWAAALGLSQFLARSPAAWSRKRFLELGCGLALPSMLAHRLGASVTASDFHPHVADLLKRNLARNGIEGLAFAHLDWCEGGDTLPRFDIIVASDILYEPAPPHELIAFLTKHLAEGGRIFVADIGRVYFERFLEMIGEKGFKLSMHRESVDEGSKEQKVHIAEFYR